MSKDEHTLTSGASGGSSQTFRDDPWAAAASINPADEASGSREDAMSSGPGWGKAMASAEGAYRRGAVIGRYLVLDMLGQGAMGAVYVAYDPELDRRVAVKLLHTARRSPRARKRLEREARALAKVSHPNVVQVHDAGVHLGDVFVAMELVDGCSFKQWCERQPRPDWREVLAAYLDAARGLAAAHAKGLVHRDVKPANILRGADGRARMVDFGLAATQVREHYASERHLSASEPLDDQLATDSSLQSSSSLRGRLDERMTEAGTIMGTPAFMAPEQYASADVGPAADQYGFCASLYEGLYGTPAFEKRDTPHVLVDLRERKLRGEVAPPPSDTRVPAWVHKLLLRGMAAQPSDRYPSMEALIAALGQDPGAKRRARLRGAGVALAIASAALPAMLGWFSGSGARDACERVPHELGGVWDDAVRARLREAFLATGRSYASDAAHDASSALDAYAGSWTRMRVQVCRARQQHEGPGEVLELRELCLERRRQQLGALATVLVAQPDPGGLDKAVQAAHRLAPIDYCADIEALAARVRLPEDPLLRARVEALQPRVDRLEALVYANRHREGLAEGESLLAEIADLAYPPQRGWAAYWVGHMLGGVADYPGAQARFREAMHLAATGQDDILLARSAAALFVIVGVRQQRFAQAEPMEEWISVLLERAKDDETFAYWLNARGNLLSDQGEYEQALVEFERARAIRARIFGPDHPYVAGTLSNMGLALDALDRHEQAMAMHERSLAISSKHHRPAHSAVTSSLNNLANVLMDMGQYQQSRVMHERSLSLTISNFGPEHHSVGMSYNNLGNVYYFEGQYQRARELHERGLAIREKALGPEHPDVASSIDNLGSVLAAMGQYRAARELHERGLRLRERALGPAHPLVSTSLAALGVALAGMGQYQAAREMHERALAIREQALGPHHPMVAESLTGVAHTLTRLRQPEVALGHLERALSILEHRMGSQHPSLAPTLVQTGEALLARAQPEDAVPHLERALALGNKQLHGEALLALARALWALGPERERALAMARRAREFYRSTGNQAALAEVDRWLAKHT